MSRAVYVLETILLVIVLEDVATVSICKRRKRKAKADML